MKIFTAAPIPLTQNSWNRDITLLYRGLQELGVESKCVRLNATDGADFPGVIQTSIENMQSAAWWRQHALDAVVLNSWGNPRHTPIVRAIKDAGATVLVRLDTNGLNSPWVNPLAYGRRNYSAFRDNGFAAFKAGLATLVKIPLYAIPQVYDLKSLAQFELADYIGVESEMAYERISRLVAFYRRTHLINKLHIIRHPVGPDVLETDLTSVAEKQKSLIAVGRWRAHQKNTPLLISVLAEALKVNQEYNAHLIGSGEEEIKRRLCDLPQWIAQRIHAHGPLSHDETVLFFQRSRICLLTSRYESGPIVAAEALCCGCSFFAQDNGSVPLDIIRELGAGGGVQGGSHRLAEGLLKEMERWNAGEYHPRNIAEKSRNVFSYKRVAENIVHLIEGKKQFPLHDKILSK